MKRILRELYPLEAISFSRRTVITNNIAKALDEWTSGHSFFLNTETFGASMLVPIIQRQRNVLNLIYWHAVLLTNRPFLLQTTTGTSRIQQPQDGSENTEATATDRVQICLKSALEIVDIISEMTQNGQMFRAFWVRSLYGSPNTWADNC